MAGKTFQSAPLTGSDEKLGYRSRSTIFQSTLPLRERPAARKYRYSRPNFNPRSPYGGDRRHLIPLVPYLHFNPRSPYGERLQMADKAKANTNFNPRSPYGERLFRVFSWAKRIRNFNPRSPYGERLIAFGQPIRARHFNPRSPYGERRRSD